MSLTTKLIFVLVVLFLCCCRTPKVRELSYVPLRSSTALRFELAVPQLLLLQIIRHSSAQSIQGDY
jgi:hypothetical protein